MNWQVAPGDVRALLAGLAEEVWGLVPLPEIAALPGGKPWFPTRPDCRFSLSHAGELGMCAVSERTVGADVERLRPRRVSLPRDTSWMTGNLTGSLPGAAPGPTSIPFGP